MLELLREPELACGRLEPGSLGACYRVTHTLTFACATSRTIGASSAAPPATGESAFKIKQTPQQKKELKAWAQTCAKELAATRFSSPVLEYELLLRRVRGMQAQPASSDSNSASSAAGPAEDSGAAKLADAQRAVSVPHNLLGSAVALDVLDKIAQSESVFASLLKTIKELVAQGIYEEISLEEAPADKRKWVELGEAL